MHTVLKLIAIPLVLIGCALVALRLAWREYGGLVPLVGIGLPALVLAAVFGVPV